MAIQGTPWHVSTGDKLKSGLPRRHRANCVFYENGYCSFLLSRCLGSAHCSYYECCNNFLLTKNDKKIIDEYFMNYFFFEKYLFLNIKHTLSNILNTNKSTNEEISTLGLVLKEVYRTRIKSLHNITAKKELVAILNRVIQQYRIKALDELEKYTIWEIVCYTLLQIIDFN